MALTYSQLSADEQRALINQRIHEVERSHLQLAVRVAAPDFGASQDQNKEQLKALETDLDALHKLLNAVPAAAAK